MSDPVRQFDQPAAQTAIGLLLDALPVDPRSEVYAETPRRVAAAFAEFLTAEPFTATTFANDAKYDELVLLRDVPFVSLCEHHLLPFVGTVHVGYLPGPRLVGLSKLGRLVDHFARRLQLQERLTAQIADWLEANLQPHGIGVVISAEHTCMTLRGVKKFGSCTVTSALRGGIRDDARSRQEFFALTQGHTRRG